MNTKMTGFRWFSKTSASLCSALEGLTNEKTCGVKGRNGASYAFFLSINGFSRGSFEHVLLALTSQCQLEEQTKMLVKCPFPDTKSE